MGIDFRIDDAPRYVVQGRAGEGTWAVDWSDGVVATHDDLVSVIENSAGEPIDLRIATKRQEPPLPEALALPTAHWAYSGFMRFRERVARTLGIELRRMPGFKPSSDIEAYMVDHPGAPIGSTKPHEYEGALSRWEYAASWEDIDSPLVSFLNHSDCDGEMSAAECEACAPALRRAIAAFEPLPPSHPPHLSDNDRANGEALVRMMEICGEFGRRLLFG